MTESIIVVDGAHQPVSRLIWTNAGDGEFRFVPERFTIAVDVSAWLPDHPDIDAVELSMPVSWVSDRPIWRPVGSESGTVTWQVAPHELPDAFDVRLEARGLVEDQVVVREETVLKVEICGVSQFDPARDSIETPNSTSGWGIIEPRQEVFDRTYGYVPLRDRFFAGLYRSIVFLGDREGRYQGGICTGMARAALEQSLTTSAGPPSLDEILVWHGRQLCDRALVASARWLFLASPKQAFQAFRDDILREGVSDRCFDIGVPKPWRIDLLSALQREGHTVVPYAFQQSSAGRASVRVYDPNDPESSTRGDRMITFDLNHDTYSYPGVVSDDDRRTMVIPVRQRAYRDARSAVLASVASLGLDAENALRRLMRRAAARLPHVASIGVQWE